MERTILTVKRESLLAVLVVLLTLVGFTPPALALEELAAPASANIAEGTSGTCKWSIDSAGALVIEPIDGVSGQLDYLDSDGMSPWFEYRDRVSSAAFRGSVSAVGVQFLFSNCSLMKSVDLSGLDTSSVTSMYFMFADCSSLVSVDLSNLDTSSVKYMSNMFYGCSSLASVDLSGLDTSSVRACVGCSAPARP